LVLQVEPQRYEYKVTGAIICNASQRLAGPTINDGALSVEFAGESSKLPYMHIP
jgi:hypothetical protein